jgi:hypothetical protein
MFYYMQSKCPGLDPQTRANSATKAIPVVCVHLNMMTRIFAHLGEPVSTRHIPHANGSPARGWLTHLCHVCCSYADALSFVQLLVNSVNESLRGLCEPQSSGLYSRLTRRMFSSSGLLSDDCPGDNETDHSHAPGIEG